VAHLRQRCLWGPAGDQILAEEAVDNGSDETVQWTLTDHVNTVRDIAKYDPDDDMTTVVNHLIYDAFGRVTSESNPAVDSLFMFTARPFDPDTGLQNNLNRWYDATVGRWLSEDPIGFAGGDGNLYRYVGNDPSIRVDPHGLKRNDSRPGRIGYCLGQEWLCSLCCRDKASRLKPIPGIKRLAGIIPFGPPSGENETYAFPEMPPRPRGGGGAETCIVLVVKCRGIVHVFHFAVGILPRELCSGLSGKKIVRPSCAEATTKGSRTAWQTMS